MTYTTNAISEIKDHLDVVSCLQHFGVRVPEKGRNVVACLCPFHQERTGSFMVYKRENRAWCFGCQKGGDVIDVSRLFLNCDTAGAIGYWKQRLGLEGQPISSQQATEAQALRRLRDHVRRRSLELERFDIRKEPCMESYLTYVFSEKEDLDRRFRDADGKPEMLAYLAELEAWHSWADSILQGAWSYWTSRAMAVLARNLNPEAADAYSPIGPDDLSAQRGLQNV